MPWLVVVGNSNFSLEMWPLVGCPGSSEWPYGYEHMANIDLTQGVTEREDMKLEGVRSKVDPGWEKGESWWEMRRSGRGIGW